MVDSVVAFPDETQGEDRIALVGAASGGAVGVESLMGDCRYLLGLAWGDRIYPVLDVSDPGILTVITQARMLFLPMLLGGRADIASASAIARLGREMGKLVVAGVITDRIDAQGMAVADLAALEESADAVIVMRHASLLEALGKDSSPDDALAYGHVTLKNLVRDLALAVNVPCHVGVDFEDVCTVLGRPGRAVIGTATVPGPERARLAAEQAAANPLLEGVNLTHAESALVLISAASDSFRLSDTKLAMNAIRSCFSPEAHIIFGTTHDDELDDAIRITLVVTGLR